MSKKQQKTVALDFDGVLHSYTSGWKGPRSIPDKPVPGAFGWLTGFIFGHCDLPESICAMASAGEFKVVIFSSRSRYFGGRWAMKRWMVRHGFDPALLEVIDFPTEKPPAHILIDDRAVTFKGEFPTVHEIRAFKPWNK